MGFIFFGKTGVVVTWCWTTRKWCKCTSWGSAVFLLLWMLQVMYIHLKCVGFLQSNIWNADQCGIDAITSCAATIAMCCAHSHASRQISLLSCAREEMLCGKKKLWIFSSFPFSKNAVFLQLFSHEGDVLKAPKWPVFFFLSKTNNAFLNMPGRAGRVSKGYCYRLVTKRFWNKEIPDHMVPDMLVSVFFYPLFIQPKPFSCHSHSFNFDASKMKQLILCLLPLPLSSLHWPPSYWKWSCWTSETLAPSSQRPSRLPTSVTSWEQCCS